MNKLIVSVLALAAAFALAACGASTTPTGSNTDSQAAGQYLPTLAGYTVTSADSLTGALDAVVDGGIESLGNPALEAAVAGVDSFIECYKGVGAVDANIYTQVNIGNLLTGDFIPSVGTVAVINRDRVIDNFVACAASGFTAQSADGSPVSICRNSGEFSSGGDNFTYIYIGTDEEFCSAVTTHFAGIN